MYNKRPSYLEYEAPAVKNSVSLSEVLVYIAGFIVLWAACDVIGIALGRF